MATLHASGKTYNWKEWFKLKGFKWDPDEKEWVHQNLKKGEIREIIAQCDDPGIRFRAFSKKGKTLRLEDTTSKDKHSKRHGTDHDTKSMESVNGSKFYSPGHSATNAQKPYAKRFTDHGRSRDR